MYASTMNDPLVYLISCCIFIVPMKIECSFALLCALGHVLLERMVVLIL